MSCPRRRAWYRATRLLTLLFACFLLAGLLGPSAVAAGSASQSWTVPLEGLLAGLTTVGGALRLAPWARHPAALGTGTPEGMVDLPERRLAAPVSRVSAQLTADTPPGSAAQVQARGRRAGGRWTEWVPTSPGRPAVLGVRTRTVQLRLVLRAAPDGASPVVRLVRAVADGVGQVVTRVSPTLRSLTYRVYATREGLVGATTANGHVIVGSDRFAALPSRRSLSAQGSGDYTVKACAANGRCAWTPVWDVGPWNTTDNYWDPGAVRESWQDLAQGLPEAQAAYVSGYHGGRDQYGRQVLNPAGIDLADGTFSDGLGMRDNGYVSVTYLWVTGGPTGRALTYGTPLAVRAGPGRGFRDVGEVAEFAAAVVECRLPGDLATGTQGTTNLWYRIGPGQYASAAYLAGVPAVPRC